MAPRTWVSKIQNHTKTTNSLCIGNAKEFESGRRVEKRVGARERRNEHN